MFSRNFKKKKKQKMMENSSAIYGTLLAKIGFRVRYWLRKLFWITTSGVTNRSLPRFLGNDPENYVENFFLLVIHTHDCSLYKYVRYHTFVYYILSSTYQSRDTVVLLIVSITFKSHSNSCVLPKDFF